MMAYKPRRRVHRPAGARFAVLVALVALAVAAFLAWLALAPAPAPIVHGGELGAAAEPLNFEDPATTGAPPAGLTFEDVYLQALDRGGYSPNPACFEDALKVSVWTGEEHGDALCISLNDAIVTPPR